MVGRIVQGQITVGRNCGIQLDAFVCQKDAFFQGPECDGDPWRKTTRQRFMIFSGLESKETEWHRIVGLEMRGVSHGRGLADQQKGFDDSSAEEPNRADGDLLFRCFWEKSSRVSRSDKVRSFHGSSTYLRLATQSLEQDRLHQCDIWIFGVAEQAAFRTR